MTMAVFYFIIAVGWLVQYALSGDTHHLIIALLLLIVLRQEGTVSS